MMIYLLILTIVLLSGCNSTPDWVVDGANTQSPEWIAKDTFQEQKGQVEALYGVGAVQGLNNIPLSWEVSENRARAQLARILQSQMKYSMKEDTDVSFERKSAETIHQNLARQVNTTTDLHLQGGRVIERYYDDETQTFWSLVMVPAKYLHDEALINDSATMSKLETEKTIKEEIKDLF